MIAKFHSIAHVFSVECCYSSQDWHGGVACGIRKRWRMHCLLCELVSSRTHITQVEHAITTERGSSIVAATHLFCSEGMFGASITSARSWFTLHSHCGNSLTHSLVAGLVALKLLPSAISALMQMTRRQSEEFIGDYSPRYVYSVYTSMSVSGVSLVSHAFSLRLCRCSLHVSPREYSVRPIH